MTNLSRAKLFLVSAVLLAGCGDPAPHEVSMIDVAQAAARSDDRVNVEDLAHWIVEGRGDFIIVDVRMPDEFEAGQIQGAENIPLAQIVTEEALTELPTDRKVIVYSNGSENAAKASVMLRLSGVNAHVLVGGYNAWHKLILNPDITADELDGESLQVTAQRALSCYFVGDREGGASRSDRAAEPFVPPVIEIPEEEDALPPPPAEESC